MTVVPGSERHLAFDDPQKAIAELGRRRLDIATMLPVPDAPDAPVQDSDYVDLSRRSAGYRSAMSLSNQGRTVVPLRADGTPVPGIAPWPRCAEYWEEHPEASAGALTGFERDLIVASFSPDAWEWFKEFATVRPPTREQRVADRIHALGVPGSGAADVEDWDSDSPVEQVIHTDDPSGVPLMVQEILPPYRAPMMNRVSTGQKAADKAVDGLRQPIPRQWRWLCWSWPVEGGSWRHLLPGSLTRFGAVLEAALPGEGSVIERQGIRWRVANSPGLTLPPMPVWVARCMAGR
jgi:hypothetical protein